MIQKVLIPLVIQLSFIVSCKAQNNQNKMESDSSLHYLLRESTDSTTKSPMLILLHGHGSNENDLFSLADKIPNNWTVISIRGPYKLAEHSYRWYDVNMVNGKIAINMEEEETSRKKLLNLIEKTIQTQEIDREKIVVAGFSQGANMAQSLGLSEPNLFAGFAVFSGRFVEEFIPFISNSTRLKHSKAFLSHGSGDHLLPKTYADENIQKLNELGIQISYCEDSSGHSISTKQWGEFSKWLLNFN